MNCPKCEPGAASRRWLWWLAAALILIGGAYWMEHAGPPRAGQSEATGQRTPAT